MFISTRARAFSGAVFKCGAYAQLLPELAGTKGIEGADLAKIALDMLHQLDSVSQTFRPISNQPSFNLCLLRPDYELDTVLGLQT